METYHSPRNIIIRIKMGVVMVPSSLSQTLTGTHQPRIITSKASRLRFKCIHSLAARKRAHVDAESSMGLAARAHRDLIAFANVELRCLRVHR
jgi:hypothetical protein